MERVQTASLRLADRTAVAVQTLWDRHQAGELALTAFRGLAAAVVARANTQGVSLADLGVAAEITRQLRDPTPPLGVTPTDAQVDQERIADALDRVATADIDSATTPEQIAESQRLRLGRFGADEVLLTVAATTALVMREHRIERWTRIPDANPCPLCSRWADGKHRSTNIEMNRHRGCGCIQSPVIS